MTDIRANLDRVRERVTRAAERAGRRASDVLLIGVSKTVEVERIRLAIEAGIAALGDAVELFDVIHSLDRLDLARELDKRARPRGRSVEVFVEVNLAAEASKGGVAPDGLGGLLDAVAAMPSLKVRGLMAIPPEAKDPEDSRMWFQSLRKLGERHGFKELSMGMSGDFEVAIEEGATMVRVGTAIFGPRAPRPEPGAEER
jgi:PLP dependent protein